MKNLVFTVTVEINSHLSNFVVFAKNHGDAYAKTVTYFVKQGIPAHRLTVQQIERSFTIR